MPEIPTPPANLVGLQSFSLQAGPSIQQQPQSQIAYWGKGASLRANVSGSEPLTYQWFKDGVPIPGATNETLIFSDLKLSDEGNYSVEASNAVGSVISKAAFLKVNPAGVSISLHDNLYAGLIIDGVVGKTYAIQHVTDLTQTNAWITLTNLTLTSPVQLWIDAQADARSPDQPKGFYRIVPGQ